MPERKRVSLINDLDDMDDFEVELEQVAKRATKPKPVSPQVPDPDWERPTHKPSVPTTKRKRKKSERTEQFNSRVKPDLLDAFRQRLDEQELTVVVGLERALRLYLQSTGGDQTK